MCGIAGILGQFALEADRKEALSLMLKSMVHRGPDGEGRFVDGQVAMGMRRLSIIDVEHGWQPMKADDDSIVVLQNGEIYNYPDLREELVQAGSRFETRCDTEVLLHGYHQWGIDGLLERVDGMFAMAIYDRRQRVLHLARDRFGEKPLFYMSCARAFAFSSNTEALAMLRDESPDLSPEGLNHYLAMHYVAGDSTILQGIHRILPGFRMEITLPGLHCHSYRYYAVEATWSSESRADNLENDLKSSVRSRLLSDVPVGVFLSGGLDSSLVASFAAAFSPGIQTFSIGFPDDKCDETPFARTVAEHVGSTHHHFIFDENSFVELLPEVAGRLDEPVGDQALLPLFVLSEAASKEVTVVLSGEGADELFAGYGYYRPYCGKRSGMLGRLMNRAHSNGGDEGRTEQNRLIANQRPVTPSGFPLLTDMYTRKLLLGSQFEQGAYETWLMGVLNDARNPLQRATAADLLTWLPDDLLVKLDRICMMHSIEGRAPFLQPSVVSTAMRLDPSSRYDGRTCKIALRNLAKRHLPRTISDRRKQGFVLPMSRWLSDWFNGHGDADTYFKTHDIQGVDMNVLARLVTEDLQHGVRRERFLFAVVMLAEWVKLYRARVSEYRRQIPDKIKQVWH